MSDDRERIYVYMAPREREAVKFLVGEDGLGLSAGVRCLLLRLVRDNPRALAILEGSSGNDDDRHDEGRTQHARRPRARKPGTVKRRR